MASEGQHFASQHDRAKHENSAAICGLGPSLGNLRCTIDRVRERLAHIYPVGTEDLPCDLSQARNIRGTLSRHLGHDKVIDERFDLGQDALDVLVSHRRVHTRDPREGCSTMRPSRPRPPMKASTATSAAAALCA